MKPRDLNQYVDDEIKFVTDLLRENFGALNEEDCYEVIVRMTAVKETAPGYRENEVNACLADAYYQTGNRYVLAGNMQSALDNYLQAAALLPKGNAVSEEIDIPNQAYAVLSASIQDCIRQLKEMKLQVFTDEPPKAGVIKPVAQKAAAQSPVTTLKKQGSFAHSPDSAFHSQREESSTPDDKSKETKKPGLGS